MKVRALLFNSVLASAFLHGICVAAPFTVADSIQLVRLADPDLSFADYGSVNFNLSPDHRQLAIVTRRGNLETGHNEFELGVFSIAEIRAFLNSRAARMPAIETLAQFETGSIWPAIDRVQWVQNRNAIAFIGRREDGIGQVFVYDITAGKLTQLTHQTNNVLRFGLSRDERTLVYSAYVYPDWRDRNAHGYAVQSEWVGSLVLTDPTGVMGEVQSFVLDLTTGKSLRASLELSRYPTDIAVSPDGRSAIVATFLRATPSAWIAYDFVREYVGPEAAEIAAPNSEDPAAGANEAFGSRSDWLTQAMLIDTRTGTSRPLYNAPLTAGAVLVSSRWSSDSKHVVIGPTYLPIEPGMDPNDRKRRASTEVIADVDLAKGSVARVIDLPEGQRLASMDWADDGSLHADFVERATGLAGPKYVLTRDGRGWAKTTKHSSSHDQVRLSISQELNTPYELSAQDTVTGKERIFTDLNPRLRHLTLGNAEVFRWTDRLGRQHEGALVYPPDYDATKRYPVVLQGGGFRPQSFLVDGPPGFLQGASAARAMANVGILVLQLPRHEAARLPPSVSEDGSCTKWEDCGESSLWMAMTEGAVSALDGRGLIERGHVGLLGFSRVGMFVHHTLTFSRLPFAAATICDSIAATPFAYAMVYGFSPPGMLEFEDASTMGAPFWGKGIAHWEERSPAFHLDRLRTPLRLELFGQGISAHWDTFAILKRMRRPVELIHIPLEVHNAQTPFGRYTSKQGNVDWFRFWLKDEEDLQPAKAGQYERWRKLRAQYRRAMATSDYPPAE